MGQLHNLEKRRRKHADFGLPKEWCISRINRNSFAKAYPQDDGTIKTEIRLNISKTNILRPSKSPGTENDDYTDLDDFADELDDFTMSEEDF